MGTSAAGKADAEYQAYSSQVSLTVRTLALAAIAVIWLFASGRPGGAEPAGQILHSLKSSTLLVSALALALAALVLDLLQYFWGAVAWGMYRWGLEQILVNDNWDPDDLSFRVRIGWSVARAFQIPRYLEHSIGAQTKADTWTARRQELRRFLGQKASSRERRAADASLALPWSPLFINRISAIFFFSKTAVLITCYALLGRYLLA